MDFITGLPPSGGHNAIFVVVDRLSKMAHFIPTTDTVDSRGTAALFRDFVFRLHGLPRSIVSDRGTTFASEFSRSMCKMLGIAQKLSTAFHPQTDGQTERINSILEQYLRGYCGYQQDNWSELLTMAEFAYNNTLSSTTGLTPFFANYQFDPRYEILPRPNSPPPSQGSLIAYTDKLRDIDQYLRSEMTYARALQSEQADKHRSAPPALNVGDNVWLLRRHIQTTRPSTKLDFKRLGRFRIIQKLSSHAYRLELPATMKIHPVFHISLLEPCGTDPLAGHTQPPPPSIIVDDEEEQEVEEVLDSRYFGKTLKYLVRWLGYDHPTWEPADLLEHAPLMVSRYHDAYPSKPSPDSAPAARCSSRLARSPR